jgi:hypothetical protein
MMIPKSRRASLSLILVIPVLVALMDCRSGPSEGLSSRAWTMILTSGPAEIAMSSSRVPGYWARPADGGDRFYLSTRDRSFEKGSRVTVEGPFGPASVSEFHEETGEYLRMSQRPVFVLVVWKIGRAENAPRP